MHYKCLLYFIVLYCTGNVFLADLINRLCLCWQRWIHVTTTMAVVSRPVCQEQVLVSTAVSVMLDGSLTSMAAPALHLVSTVTTCFNVLSINWLLKCQCADIIAMRHVGIMVKASDLQPKVADLTLAFPLHAATGHIHLPITKQYNLELAKWFWWLVTASLPRVWSP